MNEQEKNTPQAPTELTDEMLEGADGGALALYPTYACQRCRKNTKLIPGTKTRECPRCGHQQPDD